MQQGVVEGSVLVRDCIRSLCSGKSLSGEELTECIKEIISGAATPGQIGAFLVAFSEDKITAELLLSCAEGMISFAIPCKAEGELIDIVGTGGDGFDTFNVSTAASFVIAAAGGRVAKQGNRSSSGKCGSADFIEALGIPLALGNQNLEQAISSLGFGFLFAQSYHPSLKSVGKVRKEIGVKTVFNILGPLSNPASPTYMLLGVGSPQLGPLYAEVLRRKQVKRGFVVHSDEGMDEISPCGPSTIWIIENGNITTRRVSPVEDFGLEKAHSIKELVGGSAVDNVATFKKILAGEEKGPILDYILVNAGCALHVANLAPDLASGVSLARSAINSGKVAKLVEDYIVLTNGLHNAK